MLAFDDLYGEIIEHQLLAAADGRKLLFGDAGGQRNICGRSGADDFGAEALGDERDIADMVGVAMAGEDVVGADDDLEDGLFVSLPLLSRGRFLTGEEWIDQYLSLPDLNLPAGVAEPFKSNALGFHPADVRFRGRQRLCDP